jgi:hypothetical protein
MSISICVRSHELAHSLSRAVDRRGWLHAFRARSGRSGRILDGDRALHGAARFVALQDDVCFANL